MAIKDVREAFQQGLGATGKCISATMRYPGPTGDDEVTITYQVNGQEITATRLVLSTNLLNAVRAWGAEVADGLQG